MAFVILENCDLVTYLVNYLLTYFKGQCAAKQPLTKKRMTCRSCYATNKIVVVRLSGRRGCGGGVVLLPVGPHGPPPHVLPRPQLDLRHL